MYFQMGPQIAFLRGCEITLVAFVRLFSTLYSQMCSQMACVRGVIFTLVAFLTPSIVIKVIFVKIDIHQFLHFDAFAFTTSVQLIQERENLIKDIFKAFASNFSWRIPAYI